MKRPAKRAKKSAKVKRIDDTVGNVKDRLILATIGDALRSGATIKRRAK